MFQTEIPNLLPVINEILARVNRQMLLILKTNDLLRGIESTLKTQSRLVLTWLCLVKYKHILFHLFISFYILVCQYGGKNNHNKIRIGSYRVLLLARCYII